jgi:Ala-tRNA(Pro) deacylase
MTANRLALAGYSEIPRRLIHCLNTHRVRYEIIHQPEAPVRSTWINLETPLASAYVVNASNQRVLIVIPIDRQLDLSKVRAFLGHPVRLETEDEFKWLFPDCALGAVPPFGNLYGLPTYIDRSLAQSPDIVVAAGTTTDWIKLASGSYLEIVKPILGRFLLAAKRQASKLSRAPGVERNENTNESSFTQ